MAINQLFVQCALLQKFDSKVGLLLDLMLLLQYFYYLRQQGHKIFTAQLHRAVFYLKRCLKWLK